MALDKIKSDAPEVSGDVPAVFVVNCQLPEGEPAMFNSPDDGPGRRGIIISCPPTGTGIKASRAFNLSSNQ